MKQTKDIERPAMIKASTAVLDCIRWIAGILLAMALPFAWICRDGLGPDAHESTGFEAVARVLSWCEIWVLAFAFIVLSVAVFVLRRKIAMTEGKSASSAWVGRLLAFVLAFLLCLLGVFVFRGWADRKRQRAAEDHVAHSLDYSNGRVPAWLAAAGIEEHVARTCA